MNLDNVRLGTAKLREAMELLSRGPLEYYLTELIAAHDLLMTRFAPFKTGDRVMLTKAPIMSADHGWKPCAHFLVRGSTGTVVNADCGSKGFQFGVVFDDESTTVGYAIGDLKIGDRVPVSPERRHVFAFSESYLEHVLTLVGTSC